MAENNSRFVIIDGVQIEKTRARKLGYIDEHDKIVTHKGKVSPAADTVDAQPETPADPDAAPVVDTPSVDEPTNRRARGADTARRG